MKKTRITTTIYGRDYTIIGSEPAEHLRHVAHLVDTKMHEISAQNRALDSGRLAVLTAVNATHDYLLLEEKYNALKDELARYKGRDV
ncbi:cell division protein ZapA [Listeria fleischmannii]|uniref:cell division protein ZapA n=1 Tax=Listeria fleischmannii TaxID=1069827 RepID=UPI0002BA9E43|nr:cell division protein ZapA [Listeria fleischmannii]EMG27487.1 hypothetical protein LFLEISCH_10619 [Listeria fleischmannii subsp. fleischmannii LU2006-1]